MRRDLLTLLLGLYPEPFAFDDDPDPEDPAEPEEDPEDPEDPDDDDKSAKKDPKKSDGKTQKKSNGTGSPEALRKQVKDLQDKLAEKNRTNRRLSREANNLRLKSQGKKPERSDDPDEDADVATLRQTVQDLTERLDNISSENFIETKVVRKLQPLVAAGLEDDEAERKLNAALKLVDSDEDFDDDGNFDAEAFIKKYPFLAAAPQEEVRGQRLLGGSGKASKNQKTYAADALKKFNERRSGKASKP